jgi:hypothetical protein
MGRAPEVVDRGVVGRIPETPDNVHLMLVAKRDRLGEEEVAHDIRVAKVPPTAEDADPVDHTMAREVVRGIDVAQGPTNHPRRPRLAEGASDQAVGRHPPVWDTRHDGIDTLR